MSSHESIEAAPLAPVAAADIAVSLKEKHADQERIDEIVTIAEELLSSFKDSDGDGELDFDHFSIPKFVYVIKEFVTSYDAVKHDVEAQQELATDILIYVIHKTNQGSIDDIFDAVAEKAAPYIVKTVWSVVGNYTADEGDSGARSANDFLHFSLDDLTDDAREAARTIMDLFRDAFSMDKFYHMHLMVKSYVEQISFAHNDADVDFVSARDLASDETKKEFAAEILHQVIDILKSEHSDDLVPGAAWLDDVVDAAVPYLVDAAFYVGDLMEAKLSQDGGCCRKCIIL